MKLRYYVVMIILLSFNQLYSKDPYPKNPNIDILNYSFELHLNDSTDIIYGTANINLHIEPSENNVRLDLISANNDGNGMVVHSVLLTAIRYLTRIKKMN